MLVDGFLLRPQLDKGGKFLITIRRGPLCIRSHWDHLLDGKVLMVAQIDPINLHHKAQGACCLAPQYALFGRLSPNLSFKAQRGK